MLKECHGRVEYEQAPQIVREEIPVEGAFVVHHLLTPHEVRAVRVLCVISSMR